MFLSPFEFEEIIGLFFLDGYILEERREWGGRFIVEHGVLVKYETRTLGLLKKLHFHSQICCFDVLIILSLLDVNYETRYE